MSINRNLLESKFIGSLIGLAIGDSLGAQYEGFSSVEIVKENISRFTDDTAMMIGVAESLIECHGLNAEHMAKKFVENYEKEVWRGYGEGPLIIFDMIKQGEKWNKTLDRKLYSGGSFGNGSAMRVAPIGLFYYNDPYELRKAAYISSMITHSHPLAMEGAALEAYAVTLALKEEKEFLDKLIDFTCNDIYRGKLDCIRKLSLIKQNKREIVNELGNGIEAFNSVPIAIYSFIVSSSFEDSLIYSISLGGDTDTIAAMCGAIAGAWWGVEKIPAKWKAKLEKKEYIEKLAENLWNIVIKRESE